MLKALKAAYPGRKKFAVLEDNDPAGFSSKKGIAAKRTAGICIFKIPPRSPDLNVCNFALWKGVNKQMRNQEKGWGVCRRETRQE